MAASASKSSLWCFTIVLVFCRAHAARWHDAHHTLHHRHRAHGHHHHVHPHHKPSVIWEAPFFSGGGYCSEAIAFAAALSGRVNLQIAQHGDGINQDFVSGLDPMLRLELEQLQNRHVDVKKAVVVCHSVPAAYASPFERPDEVVPDQYNPCPLYDAKFTVGRTMFEDDRLPAGWADRMNEMDAIWVPSHFNARSFRKWGVKVPVRVVPEVVDCKRFNPSSAHPHVLYRKSKGTFNFLSVFQWEERKGWRFLLQAYLTRFTKKHKVALFILTHPGGKGQKPPVSMQVWAREALNFTDDRLSNLPPVYFFPENVPDVDMPSIYRGAHALVQPTRGEGWGRPETEAMCMAKAVIATNYSGLVEFMTTANAYPLRVDAIKRSTVHDGSGTFGGKWARPSVSHLQRLMWYLYKHPKQAAAKGQQARKDMIRRFCPACVARIVESEIEWLKQRKS